MAAQTKNDNETKMFEDSQIARLIAGFPPQFQDSVIALMRHAFRFGERSVQPDNLS